MIFKNFKPSILIHDRNVPQHFVIKCNSYNKKNIVHLLEESNKKDKLDILKEKKNELQKNFNIDVSEYAMSENLINELSFLWYFKNRVTNESDLITLRETIIHIYNSNKNLPESIHNVLVDILIKNNAISIKNNNEVAKLL